MIADNILRRAISRIVKTGTLSVITGSGARLEAGDGGDPKVSIRLIGKAASWSLLIDPELTLGELYTDGRLLIEQGTILDLFQLLLETTHGHRRSLPIPSLSSLRELAERFRGRIGRNRARRNVAHHYDLDRRLYELFLDSEWQYSCAYFEYPGQSLDEAQRAKQRHVAAKLMIEPGQEVLDIGCGWGGLALYLTRIAGAGKVKGITLSDQQLAAARRSAARFGLTDRAYFELEDYRNTTGTFDRIVSVGMFEHVGRVSYDTYFQTCSRLLSDTGVMLLHTIGSTRPPEYTNPWIAKYIFPNCYLPSLSEVMEAVEHAGLIVTDTEVLRLHYAETLKMWRTRFMARRVEAARLYDERFVRMWECYLAMCEAGFRFGSLVVFQIQLAKRFATVPLLRDYIADREGQLRDAEPHKRLSVVE
jgi:cyclopropane-fatty-acyl-phospholipid synthase